MKSSKFRTVTLAFTLSVSIATPSVGCGPIVASAKKQDTFTILDTPAPPSPEKPDESEIPTPKEGEGLVYVDTDRSARVSVILSKTSTVLESSDKKVSVEASALVNEESKLLCTETPCAVALPHGAHSLRLDATPPKGWDQSNDRVDIKVREGPIVVAHSMSLSKIEVEEPRVFGPLLLETVGWTGLALTPLGFLAEDISSPGVIAGISAGFAASLILIIAGAKLYRPKRTHNVERPSNTKVHVLGSKKR